MNHVLAAPAPRHDNLQKTTTQAQWNLFSNHWWWSNPGEKTQEPTQATKDVTSSGNGSDDEDSSEETIYPTVFPGWDRSVTKDNYAPSTTAPAPRHDNLQKTTTQAQWNPFSNHWWWSNPGEKTQEPTQATKADVTSSGNGSDDEDSSEEMIYPTVFPGWDRSVAKDDYAPSTTPAPRHDNLQKTTTQAQWNPFSNHWWWSNPGEKTQEPTQATKDVTSSGNGSDDEDSSEETIYPTVFPGWDRSVTKDNYAPSTITSENEKRQGPTQHPLLHSVHSGWISQEQNPANTTGSTERHEFTVAGENDIAKESSHTAMASNHGAKQNDSAQDPLVYPGWDKGKDYATQPTIMDRIIPSRENNHEKESSTTDPTQPPLPSDNEPGQGTEGITHPTDAPGDAVLRRTTASTNKGGDDSPLTGTITESVDGVKREKATKEPLPPSTPPGSESEQASTTDGSHVNWRPGVFPDTEDRLYQLQTPLPTTVASLDGAHHEDPTQPLLPSDNEPGQGTEGITHPTDAPGDAVLRRTTASTNKGGDDSPLTGTITASTDVLQQEDITQEAWATRIVVTAVASLDGAHHEDPTQPPLPSDNEPGQGTEGITHPTDAPGDAVLRRTTAGTNKGGDDSPLTGTITESVDGVKREKATKEPLPPSTPPGSESEQASTTDGSHVNWRPGVFPDTEDRLYQLQTPLPTRFTSSIYDNQGPHKGHYESTTFPGKTIMPPTSQPRSAQVPEWLIIVAALVALALILAVCIAVNSRRRCGQKKKLVINNGKGAVEDRKTSGLNGDASKSQEMVHLVHKEQSNDRTGACDEFLTINETQNHQELDMKTGV
ncbi:CD44 antigen isoform X4 [Phalacrocorax aristotelis]|uniref:CD44 antigen isoform X4 n=1 Tax=Phalacrocorax aristotelis TaxID=126867 RepID=UPI003F4B6D1D